MPILVIIPTDGELNELIHAFGLRGHVVKTTADAKLRKYQVPSLGLTIALGGLGKVQFAVQTQYLLGSDTWGLIVCAGAAGALTDDVAIGDVVVATETVEHDIRKVGRPLMPRFIGDNATVELCRTRLPMLAGFRVHFGGIASGDEDIVDTQRRQECRLATGALAVAWEGAGGARACAFNQVPFLEIRGIVDKADRSGPRDFTLNIRIAMQNVAATVGVVAGERSNKSPEPTPVAAVCSAVAGIITGSAWLSFFR